MTDQPPPVDPGDAWWEATSAPPALVTDAAETYTYHHADGSVAFVIGRWEAHNGHAKKRFCPHSWDGTAWVKKMLTPAGERPVFDLPRILAEPLAPILLVEGEKTRAQAVILAPDGWIVTTWAGGASAWKATDWSPLIGREVAIWPDNDEPGISAARGIRSILPQLSIVDLPFDLPPGWDLADPLPEGRDSSWVQSLIFEADGGPEPAVLPAACLTFDPINWLGVEPPKRSWLVQDLVPMHVPTMLSGKGGLGKSLLGGQLAHAASLTKKWLDRDVMAVKTFAVFSEDDQDELHRRFHAINENLGTSFGDLENLRLMIREDEQSSLVDYPSPYEAGKPSAFYDVLLGEIKTFGAQFILLDSLYNFFHGNENNRVHVSQFVYVLRKLAKECNAALVFIAHPSKSGLSTGDGYAGSTAWHDAVRARLYLTEEAEEGESPALVLKTMKANYAPREGQIEVFYHNGMLWPRDTPQASTAAHYTEQADLVFLKCLREGHSQGKNFSHSQNSGNYAPKVFAKMGTASGFKKADLVAAMERLFTVGKIKTGDYINAGRNRLQGIFEVQKVGDLSPELNLMDEE